MPNRKNAAILLSTMAILAGCQTTQTIVTPPVQVTFSEVEVQNSVQKYVNLPSRTFAFDSKGKRSEQIGTPCEISSHGFSASYVTPATVSLPVFGLNTSDLTMTCTINEQQRSKSIGVVNLTADSIRSSGASGGLIGAVVASGIAGVRGNRPNDNYSYHPLNLDLNDKPR